MVDVWPGASVAAVEVVIGARVGFTIRASLKCEQLQAMSNFAKLQEREELNPFCFC